MANVKSGRNQDEVKKRILFVSAKLFSENGYTATSLKKIAEHAEINIGSLMHLFPSKEDILCELVTYMLEGQFSIISELLQGKTDDRLLFYATETTLQLYIAESGEQMRDIYNAAYSMPKTTEIIQRTITTKLEEVFKPSLPHLETKDFFELEIASGGIMRGFMTVPCDIYFTMDRKVQRFLETTFKLYDVPKEKIQEITEFVSNFDFECVAKKTVQSVLTFLKDQIIL